MEDTSRITDLALKSAASILTPLGFAFSFDTSWNEEETELTLMISSPDARYLIGNDGDRLDDLQYLINRLIQAHWSQAPRVRVDCDHYREKAEERLLARARARARQVLQTGKPAQLPKLNAYQRRLIHHELSSIPGITTVSEDTDSRFKRITISRTE